MDRLKKQIDSGSVPLTVDNIKAIKFPNFDSGRPIKEGDTIFWGLIDTEDDDITMVNLISFHMEEIGSVYKLSESDDPSQILLKLKKI